MVDAVKGAASVEGEEDFSRDGPGIYQRWDAELRLAKKEFSTFLERCRKITKRYRGESRVEVSDGSGDSRGLQMLWSTVQTQIPAVYQFPPEVEVSRRFKSKDPVSRCASQILERYLQVEVDRDKFADETLAVIVDRLLYALGQVWVEYEPIIGKVPQPVVVVQGEDGSLTTAGGEPYAGPPPQPTPDGRMMGQHPFEQIVDCRAPTVHIDVEDFLHSPARTWREVRWVARRHYFTRAECLKQFGDGAKTFGWNPQDIPLTAKAKGADDDDEKGAQADLFKRAEVWQIWDDENVCYVAQGMSVPLDMRRRPMRLSQSRWPCPRPFVGTMTSGTLVPVPDFVQWQDLADEIDELTRRIAALTRVIKVVGARPSSMDEIERVLSDAVDNEVIAVDNWAAFKEMGGLEGALSMLPVDKFMGVLVQLQSQRQERINYLYQINGVGDIMRGQGDPRATATQEEIKADYGSLRLKQMQQDLGRFIERVLEIKAEVICEMSPPEVLIEVSAIAEVEQNPQVVQAAVQMLKDSRVRDMRIDVDEESMVSMKEAELKRERMEFLTAVAPLIDKTMQASQQMPALLDVTGEILGFAVRGFNAGRDLEGTIDGFVDSVRQQSEQAREQAKNNPPPPPLPLQVERERAQHASDLEDKRHGLKMQEMDKEHSLEAAKERAQALSEAAIEQFREASKTRVAEVEAHLESEASRREHAMEMQLERYKAELKGMLDQMAGLAKAARAKRVLRETPDGQFYSEVEDDGDEARPSIQ